MSEQFCSPRCLCVVFCRSCVLLLRFPVVGLSKRVAKSCLLQLIGLFCLTKLNWVLFYKGLLSFNEDFGVLLTPGGFGNEVFQNIAVEWTICSLRCLCVVFCRSCVLLLRFFVVGNNLSKCVTKSWIFQWIGSCCLTNLNWLKGLLSFNRVFGVLLTPGGLGNEVFQNITVEWKHFSPRCLCVVFRRSCVLLLHFLVVGLNLSKCVAESCLFQWTVVLFD